MSQSRWHRVTRRVTRRVTAALKPGRSGEFALTSAVVVLVATGLAGCGTSLKSAELPTTTADLVKQAKQEGKVDWVAPKTQEQMQPVIDLFEKTYPGIKVEYSDVNPATK